MLFCNDGTRETLQVATAPETKTNSRSRANQLRDESHDFNRPFFVAAAFAFDRSFVRCLKSIGRSAGCQIANLPMSVDKFGYMHHRGIGCLAYGRLTVPPAYKVHRF